MKKFCPKCETMHEGPCSASALARVSGTGGKPKPTARTGREPAAASRRPAETAQPPRFAPPLSPVEVVPAEAFAAAVPAPPETEAVWKARLEDLEAKIAEDRRKNRERVARCRAAKKGKTP